MHNLSGVVAIVERSAAFFFTLLGDGDIEYRFKSQFGFKNIKGIISSQEIISSSKVETSSQRQSLAGYSIKYKIIFSLNLM